jgi:hypothetical protein
VGGLRELLVVRLPKMWWLSSKTKKNERLYWRVAALRPCLRGLCRRLLSRAVLCGAVSSLGLLHYILSFAVHPLLHFMLGTALYPLHVILAVHPLLHFMLAVHPLLHSTLGVRHHLHIRHLHICLVVVLEGHANTNGRSHPIDDQECAETSSQAKEKKSEGQR